MDRAERRWLRPGVTVIERPARFVVLNPNTDPAVTAMMVEIARQHAPAGIEIVGMTVPFGAPLILDEASLNEATRAVLSIVPDLSAANCDGLVVAAFGDPGLVGLRRRLPWRVVGLAQTSMASAASGGARFCVVTTTPGLVASINATASAYGHQALFAGTFCTDGDPQILMRDPARLVEAIHTTCETVAFREGVEAVIIGGGPLALAARSIRDRLPVRLIEPLREAVIELMRTEQSAGCSQGARSASPVYHS